MDAMPSLTPRRPAGCAQNRTAPGALRLGGPVMASVRERPLTGSDEAKSAFPTAICGTGCGRHSFQQIWYLWADTRCSTGGSCM